MPKPAKKDPHPGYEPLLSIDLATGRHNGTESILVPLGLAQVFNPARCDLFDKRFEPEAWARAGAVRIPPPEEEPDRALQERADREEAIRERAQQVAAARPATVAPTMPTAAASPRKRRTIAGHSVHVIATGTINERRQSIDLRTRFSSEEKRTELKAMDELLARGETRVAGLKADWRARIEKMRADMPHLSQVIARIEACCALAGISRRPLRIPPLLLVGPPGVGKTHFAMRVAELLGVPQFIYALESAETVSVLTGAEKHWSNSEPGQLFKLIMQGEYANPLVVLDELDKVSAGSNHYRPANALHAVLEPSTAKRLRDKCMDLVFDASFTVYVATANRLSTIDASLLSRFELFHIDEPGPRAAVSIARAVGHQVLRELNLMRRFEAPAGEVIQQLALLGSPRQMHKVLVAAVGRAAVSGRTHVSVADLTDNAQRNLPGQSFPDREPIH